MRLPNKRLAKWGLLSLNASIIAAQAGDHGKAFAVVAGSIRSLADRVAVSTREIGQLISGVQGGVERAVEAMEENASRVGRGVQLSNRAGDGLQRILEGSRECAEMVREIASHGQGQSAELARVDQAMSRVREISTQVDGAIREHRNASDEIARSTEKIGELGHRVKRSTEEQRNSSKFITKAMQDVMGMIEQILASTGEQSERRQAIQDAFETVREATVRNGLRAQELDGTVSHLYESAAQLERELGRFST